MIKFFVEGEIILFKRHFREKILALTVISILLTGSLVASKIGLFRDITTTFYKEKLSLSNEITNYNIKVDFEPTKKILKAQEQICYWNQYEKLESLYFHLYPNAFKSKDTAPFEKNEMKQAYPNGFKPGYIKINSIESDGEALHYTVMGKGDSILKVNLNKPLKQKESIKLVINFTVKIPPSKGRFGYGENTINIANWYPIVSVFDGEKWNLEPYYAIGDPFYSDVANYKVQIYTPSQYMLAFTGNLIKNENIKGKVALTIEAEAVRDFALIASEKFEMADSKGKNIKIKSYYFEEPFGDLALQTARDAIEIFSQIYGPYPYKQFSVAASDFFIGGMEYPNLIFIDESLYKEETKDILEYVIAHEVAHQWWYGIVGNDQIREPWLDEALTEYSTLLYYEKKYGSKEKKRIFEDMIVKYYNAYQNSISKKTKEKNIYRSIKDFENALEYQVLVYYKGAMFLEALRLELGDEIFFNIFKLYYDKYRYKNATTKDFLKLCENVSNRDLNEKFKKWLGYREE